MIAEYKDVLIAVSLLISIGGTIYTFLTRTAKHADQEVAALKKRMDAEEHKVARLEAVVSQLPSKDEVHEIKLSIAKMDGAIAVQTEAMNSVQRTMMRIEGYLLEKGK